MDDYFKSPVPQKYRGYIATALFLSCLGFAVYHVYKIRNQFANYFEIVGELPTYADPLWSVINICFSLFVGALIYGTNRENLK